MEIVNTVVAALVAGTAVGFSDTASAAVKDAYSAFKSSTGRILRRRGAVDEADVEEQLTHPENHRDALTAALAEADDAEREQLNSEAERFLGMVRTAHHDHRKVVLWKSHGSAGGDNASIINNWR